MSDTSLPPANIAACLGAVGAYFGLSRVDLICSTQRKSKAVPRQLTMWLAARHTAKSLPEIGRYMGGRDHTTVLHGIRRVDDLMSRDPAVRLAAEQLDASITAAREQTSAMTIAELPDPVRVALGIVERQVAEEDPARQRTGTRINPSTAEIAAMAQWIVNRAIAAKIIVIEGDEIEDEEEPAPAPPPPPPPQQLPTIVPPDFVPAALREPIDRLLYFEEQIETVRYTLAERGARASFDRALKDIRSYIEGAAT